MKLEKLNYSKEEAAEVVGVSKHTITRDVRLGRIQVRRYGRRILIPAEEVRRIANGMTTERVHAGGVA